ncbi:MAG TPA: protein kinase, partial [Polyangiaceae bacterium]
MPGAPPDCPSEDRLLDFVGGRADPEQARLVERHLADCNACAALVAEIAHGSSQPTAPPESVQSSDAPPLLPGDRVGRYVVLEPIGAGGMGTVYAARDPSLDREVALKLLRRGTGGPDLEARLLREAKAMARLAHPEIVTIFDTGWHDGQLFIAMELLRGGNLRQWLDAEPRPWRAVLEAYLRAGRGLARAHAAGIIHRDFKPDNVLVDDAGLPRVTDFGLARSVNEAPEIATPNAELGAQSTMDASLTRTGVVLGTPAYMAPEQLQGIADARSDVFSFCVALYEGLYGQKPFRGGTLQALQQAKLYGEIAPPAARPSAPPARLRRVLGRGLQPRSADRFGSMEELLGALEKAARPPGRKAAWAATSLAAAGAIVWGFGGHREPAEGSTAATTSASVAPANAECTTNRACQAAHGGEPWICRAADHRCAALASIDCAPRFEEGDLESDDTVWFGVLAPTKADAFGTLGTLGADLARQEIAQVLQASGAGARTRRVALVACDDAEDP